MFLRTLGGIWSALMLLFMLASFALSIAMTMVPALFNAVSSAVEAVTDRKTIRREFQENETRLKRQTSEADARARNKAQQLDAERVRHSDDMANMRRRLDLAETNPIDRPVRYRGRQIAIRDAVGDTSQRISKRVQAASMRNVGSTFGEGLPVIGVGVIVAATAWELHDACQLMGEMRALDAAFNPDNPISDDEVCGITPPTAEEVWAKIKSSPGAIWDESKELYNGLPDVSLSATYEWSIRKWDALSSYFVGDDEQQLEVEQQAEEEATAIEMTEEEGSAWNPMNWFSKD